jgi:hypothetical protein
VFALLAATAGAASTPLPKDSPFLPVNATTGQISAGETLEFAGVSTVGAKIDLIIHDKTARKSRWIPLGETVAGITALKYDSRLEQAVVRANGVEKVLALRKATGPRNAPIAMPAPVFAAALPMPVPSAAPSPATFTLTPVAMDAPAVAPTVPESPPTPETIAKQETEARMLVSDLLEIGMAQRKAYEDAQRRGLTGPPADAANPPPAPDGN